VRGEAGIFLKEIPTEFIFKYPVLIPRTPGGSSQLGVGGGGGPSKVTDSCKRWGDSFPTQIISQLVDPRPHILYMWAWGGGADLGGSGQAIAIRWVFFSNFQLLKETTPTIT
jgi:hypothetical protein